MAKYRYHVKNYHSIKDADIKIDGITVLAGINGCGKSTLSRWLYYIVNAINDFNRIQRVYFIDSLTDQIDRLLEFLNSTSLSKEDSDYQKKYQRYINELSDLSDEKSAFDTKIIKLSGLFSSQAKKDLKKSLCDASESVVSRAYDFLMNKIDFKGTVDELLKDYSSHYSDFFNSWLEYYKDNISSKKLMELRGVIMGEYDNRNDMPDGIRFEENGVTLIDDENFSEPLMLKKAIYIDTPMVLSGSVNKNSKSVWGRFFNLLVNTNGKTNEKSNILEINRIIKGTIGGKIKLQEEFFGLSNDIHYVRNDGLNIRIEDAATGIKSFAYIQRLLDNGWLTNETVLLIDEPEAHLHPQWIVDFARVLVLLNKYIGVKIVVASHNPDMVSAIHDMTEYYGILDDTNFYVAKKDEESGKYEYKNLNHEIGEIFESFNIALAKISDFTVEK